MASPASPQPGSSSPIVSGLVPGADNSGGRTRHRSGSKAGNRYLKLAFSHAGIRAVQYYPEIRAFFKAKARRKTIRIARSVVALELARIVYHVLTKSRRSSSSLRDVQVLGSWQPKQVRKPFAARPASSVGPPGAGISLLVRAPQFPTTLQGYLTALVFAGGLRRHLAARRSSLSHSNAARVQLGGRFAGESSGDCCVRRLVHCHWTSCRLWEKDRSEIIRALMVER